MPMCSFNLPGAPRIPLFLRGGKMQCPVLYLALCLAMCLIPAFPAAAAGLTQAQATLFKQAGDQYGKGGYGKVLALLNGEVVEKDTPHPYAASLYGLALMETGKPGLAVEIFRKGLQHAPKDFPLLNNLALALLRAQRHAEAAGTFLQASRTAEAAKEGKQTALRYSAAQCYYTANRYAEAEKIIAPLADGPSVPVEWLRFAAAVSMHQRKWAQGEKYFGRLTRMEPAKPENWRGLAYARSSKGDKAGAAAALEVLTRLPGAGPADRNSLFGIYIDANAPLQSLRALQRTAFNGEQERDATIAALNKAGRDEELLRYLDGLLAAKSEARLYLLKGIVHYRMRNTAAARAAFRAGAAFAGEAGTNCRLLEGFTAWEQRDLEGALRAFAAVPAGAKVSAQARQSVEAIRTYQQRELEMMISGDN